MSDRTYLPGRLAEHEPGGNLRVPRTFRVELTLILLLACSGREPLPQPNSAEVHRTLIRRFYQDVWNTGNLALRDTFLAANYLGHIAGDSVALDRAGWSRRLGALRKTFPDAQFTVEDVFSEGNRVAARLTMLGTHRDTLDGLPGTGRPVRVSGMSIIHLQDGRIAESWEENDALGRSQEIRAVPKVAPPSTDQADSKSDFLPPISHSKDVPARVREALFKRGCRIAEWRAKTVADNVVRGRFTGADHDDWAALCTRVRTQILVFRPDSTIDSVPASNDNVLGVAEPAYIIGHLEWYGEDSSGASLKGKGDSLRRVITHQGIEEADFHCCSTVHYWDGRRWAEYPGAD